MKVQLDLSATPIEGWLRPDDVKARITVVHLFGDAGEQSSRRGRAEPDAGAAQVCALRRLPLLGSARSSRSRTTNASPPTVTDDKGTAEFNLDLKRFVGRAYRLNVLGRAYEAEGGRNVAAQNSAIVSEAPFLVGVKPDGDLTFVRRTSARAAHWLAVDQRLAPVAADGLTLEWVQRKFVSVLTKQNNGTLQYVSRLKEIVRNTRSVQIAAGGSSFPLPTEEPGDFVLVLRDAVGSRSSTRWATPWRGRPTCRARSSATPSCRSSSTSRPTRAATRFSVSIRAPYIGAGLITIERDRVYRHQWFKTTTTSSVQQITLPADFEGNGYVSVQFLRDPSSDELFMSPLSYGVAAFSPEPGARARRPSRSTVPGRVKPGATLTMRLTPGRGLARRGAGRGRGHPAGGAVQESRSARVLLPEAHARGRARGRSST